MKKPHQQPHCLNPLLTDQWTRTYHALTKDLGELQMEEASLTNRKIYRPQQKCLSRTRHWNNVHLCSVLITARLKINKRSHLLTQALLQAELEDVLKACPGGEKHREGLTKHVEPQNPGRTYVLIYYQDFDINPYLEPLKHRYLH